MSTKQALKLTFMYVISESSMTITLKLWGKLLAII